MLVEGGIIYSSLHGNALQAMPSINDATLRNRKNCLKNCILNYWKTVSKFVFYKLYILIRKVYKIIGFFGLPISIWFLSNWFWRWHFLYQLILQLTFYRIFFNWASYNFLTFFSGIYYSLLKLCIKIVKHFKDTCTCILHLIFFYVFLGHLDRILIQTTNFVDCFATYFWSIQKFRTKIYYLIK